MMARGNRALQAALGAIAGGFTGYAEDRKDREERERIARAEARQAELDKAAAEREELILLSQLGYKVAPAVKAVDEVATRTAPASRLPEPSAAFGQPALTAAFNKAVQQDMGVAKDRGALTTPVSLPPLTSALSTAESKVPATPTPKSRASRPTRSVTFRGQTVELTAPKSEEEKAADEAAATQRSFDQMVARFMKTGMSESDAIAAALTKPGFSDIRKTPGVIATERGQDISASTTRRGQDISAETTRRGQDLTYKAAQEREGKTAVPANEIEKRLPVGARGDIADYNAAIRTLQEAMVEVEKSPGAFGLIPMMYSKGGAVGRYIRANQEGEKSKDYTRARAQMQSALMKLRKTQFGTQMTKLEKETGEEVFPSGSEDPVRLREMLEVLAGNAEQLRRGVYEANNASDLYTPITTGKTATPQSTSGGKTLEQEFPDKSAQIQAARAQGYSDADIRAHLTRGR